MAGKLLSLFSKIQLQQAYDLAVETINRNGTNDIYASMAAHLNNIIEEKNVVNRHHARYWAQTFCTEKQLTTDPDNTYCWPSKDKENGGTFTTNTAIGTTIVFNIEKQYNSIEYLVKNNIERRLLIIPDLHEPFTLDGYREFVLSVGDEYNCNCAIFLGDLLDNHYSSFHETDPDGDGGRKELDRAVAGINKWYEAIPYAKVLMGNHDAIPARKAFKAGLSTRWVKSVQDVVNTPQWDYVEEYRMDDVLYVHGIGGSARVRMADEVTSVCQGHYHSKSYLIINGGYRALQFAMQLGCGIDREQYAFAYGKHFKKPIINCGVILDNGKIPIIRNMKL